MTQPADLTAVQADTRRPRPALVLLWAVLVAMLSQAPNWWGCANLEPGTVFIGSLAPWSEDVTYHLSFAEQARRGALLFEDKYNGDRIQTRLIANAYFLLLGSAARLAQLEVTDAALFARFAVAVGVLLSAYCFASRLLRRWTERVFFMALAPFGSGLGWLPAWGVTRPFESLDLWAVEISTFRGIADDMIAPVTTAMLLWTLLLVDRALIRPVRTAAITAGVVALLLGAVHPHDLLVTVYAVATLVALLRATVPGLRAASEAPHAQRFDAAPLRVLLWIVACSSPILAYDAYVLWHEPLFWHYVTLDDAFRPLALAAGFGVPLMLALPGAYRALHRAPTRFLLLAIWLGTVAVLLFVPVPPCRQFFLLHGVQIGLSVFAAFLLAEAWRLTRRLAVEKGAFMRVGAVVARCGLMVLLASSCLTNLVYVQRWTALLRARPPDRFVPADLARSLRWLERHAASSSTLLAAEGASRLAPALAGVRVLAGQDQQTVDYSRWKIVVTSLLAEQQKGALLSSLQHHGVEFVLIGPEEERIGGPGLRLRLNALECVQRVHLDHDISLYERRPCGSTGENEESRCVPNPAIFNATAEARLAARAR